MTDLITELLEGPRDGRTFHPERDTQRLNRQAKRVFVAMSDGQWHCLADLSSQTGDPEASISARLRDLRKPRFNEGQWTVVSKSPSAGGLWFYRLTRDPELISLQAGRQDRAKAALSYLDAHPFDADLDRLRAILEDR